MKPHTEYQGLKDLPAHVHEQRRKVAARLRTEREERAKREEIDALMEAAGAEVVTCQCSLGLYEVRRAITRDGRRYASVTPIDPSKQT